MSQVQMQSFGDPVPDDPMETEAERRAGQTDDIDIDLDFVEGSQHDVEDQYMSEDVTAFDNQGAGPVQADDAYNDDEMAEDGREELDIAYEASIQDEELHDAEEVSAVQPDEDDDLIDDVDEEPFPTPLPAPPVLEAPRLQQSTGHEGPAEHIRTDEAFRFGKDQDADQAQPQLYTGDEGSTIHSHQNPESFTDQEAAYITSQVESQDQQQRKLDSGAHELHTNVDNDKQQQPHDQGLVNADISAQVPLQNTIPPTSDTKEQVGFEIKNTDSIARGGEALTSDDHSDLGEKLQTGTPNGHPTDETKPVGQDEASSEAITHVHPVIVLYQGTEVSLFRPTDEDRDFLLEDERLADASLANLLVATRPVLGEDVSEQELVVNVDDLDLRIYESARDTLTTTMSQLIDIYLELQHRDGFAHPPALHLSLFTQPGFSHRLAILRNALEEGRSLSQIRQIANVQEEESHGSVKEDGSDGALVLAEATSPGRQTEEQKYVVLESDAPDVLTASAGHEGPIAGNAVLTASVENDAEAVPHAITTKAEMKKSFTHTDNGSPSEEFYPQQAQSHDATNPSQMETEVQHGQEADLPDDQEDIIDYDEQPIDPASSSASSTLRGDVSSVGHLASPSDPSGAIKEEVDTGTAASSHNWDGPSNGPASQALDRNEETGDLNTAENGREEVDKPSDRDQDKHLDVYDSVDGEQPLEYSAQSNKVDGSKTGTPVHSDDFADDGEYQKSVEDHRQGPVEGHLKDFPPEDPDVVDENDYIEEPADLEYDDQGESNDQLDLPQEQGEEHSEPFNANVQSPGDIIEDLEATAADEDDVNDEKALEDPDVQAPLLDIEVNDEFTIVDEGETEDDDSRSAGIKQTRLPPPGSLKRPRSHPNADDTTAQDSQEMKRTRPG